MRGLVRALLALVLMLAGLAPASAQERGPLVLAAASLQEALNDAADRWTAKGHARPVLSFAASSALARQVEAGARADLFIPADEIWMDYVQRKGLLRAGTRARLTENRLVLIAPAGSKVALGIRRGFPLAQALGRGRLAMADPAAVPAGRYGREALVALGVWSSVAGRVAAAENVRAAMALVERGAAPLGIVYATDARASKSVRVVGVFPAGSHPPITYPVALLKASAHRDAEAFRRFLISAEGRGILARRGFGGR
ncbi:MAG: molybdate ABC transporter substrate-binding protein [Novosphingobium sp. 17-62-19]|uniref:molybdate ABC transporter substrate-binding protein n=1 Tax=Novosphingobium sp. 17-62-19 TaxID=1970406 RepID=UPI000BD8BA19|nr:molybdate ABC transporter substrate-binding protein [Novosphingobium sp. 17-62-19]OYX95743.1 MAG: molybdate ABC transporter substrate-binding protein [Novosphingobium sp. 35-62-5]OZA19267.1 MAG: molybdate ABC transporter substrate-binding protein [Novosphingobium sp. 17-62-19]HQS97333.1 molybdate ABC transporter substrate-binding protein [Novosphingobium sp.]